MSQTRKNYEAVGLALDSYSNPWINNKSGSVMRFNRDAGTMNFSYQEANIGSYYSYSDFTGYEPQQLHRIPQWGLHRS